MKIFNPWVGYVNRSYLSIKSSLLNRLGQVAPEVTDHSESNILVVIISMFAGIAEMLNYYIDNMAREAFITTARRYSSVVKHTKLIDYRIKAAIPSTVDIMLTFIDDQGNPVEPQGTSSSQPFTILTTSKFSTDNGVVFRPKEEVVVNLPAPATISIPVFQHEFVENNFLGVTDGTDDQVFILPKGYSHNTINLKIEDDIWYRQDTLGRSEPTDKHFIVEVSATKEVYVRFGDNINGARPVPGKNVIADFFITSGREGNVDANTITTVELQTENDFTNVVDYKVNNPLSSVAGTDYESIERIRRSAPLHLRTLDRAVTFQDYEDIAILSPGVDKGKVFFDCGKTVDVYISPNYGGVAQQGLLQSTWDFFEPRKMVTTFIRVLPAGISNITVGMTVMARKRRNPEEVREDIIDVLSDAYSYRNSDINKHIRTSDIIALVDNLEKVDYLNLDYIFVKPYFRNEKGGFKQIDADVKLNEVLGFDNPIKWLLQFDGNYMRLFKNYNHVGNIELGVPFQDPTGVMEITINDTNNYELGDEWVFYTYPINKDVEIKDYSIPIIRKEDVNLTINTQF